MKEQAAVLAGMEMLVWEVNQEEWRQSLAQRRAFLRSRADGGEESEEKWAQHYRFLDRDRPTRVLFTSTGILYGALARRWRSRWWHIDRIRITRAGWEVLELRWRHAWGLRRRELTIVLPPGVRPHVTDMVEVLAERLPGAADLELIVEPGNEEGGWFAAPSGGGG